MFDSGYDLELVKSVLPFELPEQTPEQTIPAQLARAASRPEDVDAVINSHLHFDHCGGNKHLTNATTYLHRDELRQARNAGAVRAPRLRRPGLGPTGARVLAARGRRRAREGPSPVSHARAHGRSLLAARRGPGRGAPLLFMADVSYTPAAYATSSRPGFHNNPVDGVRSIRRIKRLAEGVGRAGRLHPRHGRLQDLRAGPGTIHER